MPSSSSFRQRGIAERPPDVPDLSTATAKVFDRGRAREVKRGAGRSLLRVAGIPRVVA